MDVLLSKLKDLDAHWNWLDKSVCWITEFASSRDMRLLPKIVW